MISAETGCASKMEKELADMRRQFVDEPALVLPAAGKISFGFDPNGLLALDENSVVYRPLRVSDRWVSCRRTAEWSRATRWGIS